MTMMSADFDAFESGTPGKMGDDNPLAVFESSGGDSGGGEVTASDGTVDFLGLGGAGSPSPAANPRAEEEVLFDDVHAGMMEYDLSGNAKEQRGGLGGSGQELAPDEGGQRDGDGDSVGPDLLDMEGWNLRKHRTEEGENDGGMAERRSSSGSGSAYYGPERYGAGADDVTEQYQYGSDKNTPNMAANARGERNNSRRGLFGGWGSSRARGEEDKADLLVDETVAAPAWSSVSKSNKGGGGGGGGGGLFRRRSANPNEGGGGLSKPMEGIGSDDLVGAAISGEGGVTGDADDELIDPELDEEQRMDNRLRPGDHIFVWQTYGINLRAYQRHAVVFSVTRRGDVDPLTQRPPDILPEREEEQLSFDTGTLYTDEEEDVEVTVVSFYHLRRHHQAHGAAVAAQAASGNKRGKRGGCKREHLYDFLGPDAINRKKPVHKVRYGRKVKKGLLSQKAGVGTALKKDRVGLILARVQYLLDNPDHLPAHNALSANGECASLWCVTGRWCTLQGASILAITSVGQAGGALLAGGILSNLTILVPMPGLWGMAGWWWYVPATVAYPFLVPMLVALGMASLVPLEILRRNRKKWRGITDGMNHEFWSNASDDIKAEHFGDMAMAEREAEMRTFFGMKEGEATAADADARYMPVGGAPGGPDDDEEDEALAMQRMENSCNDMAAGMNVDLSGKPPAEGSPKQGGGRWGSFLGGGFRNRSERSMGGREVNETERFHTSYSDAP